MPNRWPDFYFNFTRLVRNSWSFLCNENFKFWECAFLCAKFTFGEEPRENLVELFSDLNARIEELETGITIYIIDVRLYTLFVESTQIIRGNFLWLCKLFLVRTLYLNLIEFSRRVLHKDFMKVEILLTDYGCLCLCICEKLEAKEIYIFARNV